MMAEENNSPQKNFNPYFGVNRIGDNLFQINIPHLLGRQVNIYLIVDDGLTLIDAGHSHESSITFLKKSLSELGYAFKDISRIIYTHPHIFIGLKACK